MSIEICPVCKGTMNVPAGFYNTCMTEAFAGSGAFEKCRSCSNGLVRDFGLTALERKGEDKLERGKGSDVSFEDVRGIYAEKTPTHAPISFDDIRKYNERKKPTPTPTVERFRVMRYTKTDVDGKQCCWAGEHYRRIPIGKVVATETDHFWKVDIGTQVLKLNRVEYTALINLMLQSGCWERV